MSDAPLTIQVNGSPRPIEPGTTVAELLEGLDLPRDGVAVAVDGQVVPRGDHGDHVLSAGAEVEVIRAVGGG